MSLMGRAETLPDNNLRVSQKPETTTAVVHEQLSLWSSVPPSSISENHPLQAGPDNGLNIRLGADIIQALNNGAPVTLHLNPEGGGASVSGDLIVAGVVDAAMGVTSSNVASRGQHYSIGGSVESTMMGTSWISSSTDIQELGIYFTAPASGAVYFIFTAKLSVNTVGQKAHVAIELFEQEVQGTQVIFPSVTDAIECGSDHVVTNQMTVGSSILVPGQTYYVRLVQNMSNTTAVGTVWGRSLAILPRL